MYIEVVFCCLRANTVTIFVAIDLFILRKVLEDLSYHVRRPMQYKTEEAVVSNSEYDIWDKI